MPCCLGRWGLLHPKNCAQCGLSNCRLLPVLPFVVEISESRESKILDHFWVVPFNPVEAVRSQLEVHTARAPTRYRAVREQGSSPVGLSMQPIRLIAKTLYLLAKFFESRLAKAQLFNLSLDSLLLRFGGLLRLLSLLRFPCLLAFGLVPPGAGYRVAGFGVQTQLLRDPIYPFLDRLNCTKHAPAP
jgi:hypothetical protein